MPCRSARCAQRARGHRHRAPECTARAAEGGELSRGPAGRDAAAALFDDLDETIEGVDRQLHETNATRTYVRMRSAAERSRPRARYSRSSPGLRRYTMRPRSRSYGESSIRTRSPGFMRMRKRRIFPAV